MQPCPRCGQELPVDERLSTWCDACGWNLAPPDDTIRSGRLERAYRAAGNRLGRALVRELRETEALEPRTTPSLLAAYAIAVAIHLLVLSMAVGAVVLLVVGLPNPFAALGALLFGGLAFLMRPRFGEMPEGIVVTERDAPRLTALVREVADALGMPPPARVVIDHEFNGGWALVGLRREPVMLLGLPLLTALEPQERVALIGHEIGHGRNGDARRGLVIGTAVDALLTLRWMLEPDRGESGYGAAGSLADAAMWVLSRPVVGLLYLEYHLLMRESQRAEFLADDLGARVAGTPAALSIEEKLLLTPLWSAVVRGATVRREDVDLFARLREAFENVPERERERRRRVARLEDTRLDLTHPPSGARIELLEARPPRPEVITLSAYDSAAIDEELRPLRPALAATALDESAGLLYTG
ncbi:MAG: hypothetical protein QOD86_1856 [Miltoncostaeaceae bacterium]|nr:hypothetical protein [Miltoncostaeaceae bacterium]